MASAARLELPLLSRSSTKRPKETSHKYLIVSPNLIILVSCREYNIPVSDHYKLKFSPSHSYDRNYVGNLVFAR